MQTRAILAPVLAASLLAGCAYLPALSARKAGERGPTTPSSTDERLRRQTQELERQTHELELKLARSHLTLLEKDAQIQALQQKLQLATQEVVRSMAKLRGVESKAEAASNLAEAEIALRMLEREAAERRRDQDVQQAKHLMQMAVQEFTKQNYGGTLYLAGQVKALSANGHARASANGHPARLAGEAGFASPVPLQALRTSNVRAGPGLTHGVVFVVPTGQSLTGHSQKDLWVRVSRADGRSGWILYRLVGPR